MIRVPYLEADSQVVMYVFDFVTRLRHVFVTFHNRLVEAELSRIPFDILVAFPMLENELNPDRDVSDLMLDCVWSEEGTLRMEILPGLLEVMPRADPSTIEFTIVGKGGEPGERIYWKWIGLIVVYAFLEENCFPIIQDDELLISVREESAATDWPEEYTPYGNGMRRRKAERRPERKGPDRAGLPEGEEPGPAFIPGRMKGHLTVVEGIPEVETVGRRLKLYYIPSDFYNSASFAGLKLGEIELYRIMRTYAPVVGGGNKNRYNEVGIKQLCGLLEQRKADLLLSVRGEKRKEVLKIKISETSVKRYVKGLLKRGLLVRVVEGWPRSYKTGQAYVSKYLVVTSEKQRFKLIQERKERRSR